MKSKLRLQLLTGAMLLVICTAPWKPVSHWPVTEYSTVHAGVAPDAVTTGTTMAPRRAVA